jgi:fucose 4-O-acetylase-like acetyltransferase
MKERLTYIDKIKGIAIFLVVFEHLLQQNTEKSVNHVLYGLFYPFLMPLFMFVSGYLGFKTYKPASLKEGLVGLANKALVLLLPYTIWSIIEKDLSHTGTFYTNFPNQLYDIFTKWNRLWFLWYLFNVYIFYTFYLILVSKEGQKSFIIDVLSLLIFLVLGGTASYFNIYYYIDINPFLSLAVFFFLGVILSKNEILKRVIKHPLILFAGFLAFFLLIGQYQYLSDSKMNKLVRIVVSCASIIVIYNVSSLNLGSKKIDEFLQRYGKNSLIIYILHFFLVEIFINNYFFPPLGIFYTFLFFSINAMIVVEMCLFIKKVVSTSSYLNFLLFGEKLRR